MAAPTFVTASTGATDAGGAFTATGAAPGAAGRIIILHVFQDGTTDGAVTFTSATNIENLAGTDNQWTSIGEFQVGNAESGRHYLWIGRSLSTSAPTFTGGNSTSEDLYFRMYEFSGVSLGTTLATVIENVTAGTATGAFATSTSVADVGVTTLGTNRLALNFIAVDDDVQAAELTAMTGETGGDWAYPVAAYGDASGTDGTVALVTATIAAAGTINGGTDTITSGGWGVVGFALIPDEPTFTQAEAAFYEDGTEAGSTVIDSGADSITRDISGGNSNILLRVRLQETNGAPALATDDYQLQYELNDSGGWQSVGDTGSVIDSYAEANRSTDINMYAANQAAKVAQSFTGNGSILGKATFYLKKAGSPTGNATAKIYAHSGTFGSTSVPTGAALATSDNFDVSTLTGSSQLIDFTFSGANKIALSNGTRYCVAIEHATGDASNRVQLAVDDSSPTHGGNIAFDDAGTWVALADTDMCFYVYTAPATAAVGFASGSLTDGNATTNRLGSGTGSFVAGEISEDGLVDNSQITASNFTEELYSLTLVAAELADADTLDFRVLRNGATTGITYTVVPRITVEESAAASAAVTGTITPSATEADIVAGGKTIIITLTGDTWVTAGAAFDGERANIAAGIDSAQSEANGWDAVVKAGIDVGDVVRTSDTVVTVTLDAEATYDITATETITVTVPDSAVTGTGPYIATPTFTVTPISAVKSLATLGVG